MADSPKSDPTPGSRRNSEAAHADLWQTNRSRLLDIGYRMLGSVAEAEDVAAEAYARLLDADPERVTDPVGWLITVTGRLCIDRLRSADRSRRAYVGPWLPEPLVTVEDRTAVDPADRITLDDSVRMALLVVLEHLSPAERTAFVLHDLFALPFEEVAEVVGRSPAACRQLASRARRRIRSHPERPRQSVPRQELERIANRFADACSSGAIEPLLEVLDPDVVGDFDSGGNVPGAPLEPLRGARSVAAQLTRTFANRDLAFVVRDINGEPGVLVVGGDRTAAVICLVPVDDRIGVIHAVGNPAKLTKLTRLTRLTDPSSD